MWGGVKSALQEGGHDVVWIGDSDDPGDEEILALANVEQRILVTLDKDFGELAIRHSLPHRGILRLVNFRMATQAIICVQILNSHGDNLYAGAIITAEPGRIRIRPADSEESPG